MPKKKKVKSKSASPDGLQSFEQSLHDLEKVVSELESGNLTLSDSLAKYEEGIKNLKTCHRILESAENRIRLLTGVDRDGNPLTQEFDESATELNQRAEKKKFKTAADFDQQSEQESSPRDAEFEDSESESTEDEDEDSSGSLF